MLALRALLVVVCAVAGWPRGAGAQPAVPAVEDLTAAFTRAADEIRRHQRPDGAWLTAVTLGPAHQQPTSELNVFTPAVIVDLLAPVAREAGLADVAAKGRAYLGRQIEASGLVRYHGDPGSVPPAIRGCELPPDADDTALAWRIAPRPEAALADAARREIERYRDDGLYRTWLADDQEYRCFYVRYAGREWNPPDVAVDMHVYLFLVDRDRAAAARLCEALARRIDDDRIWIWYTVAPLVPLLRQADLARQGCPVAVPRSRIDHAAAGQQPYTTQARLLLAMLADPPAAPAADVVRALREAAAEGFARLVRNPPLLFHNDLSAFPPHFHWSEDFGYALWLRLYVETARRWPGMLPLRPPGASSG